MTGLQEDFARNMRSYREFRGLTQMEVAQRADLSLNFVSMIELGRKFPSPDSLEAIASALSVQPFQLFLSSNPTRDLDSAGLFSAALEGYIDELRSTVDEFNRRFFEKRDTERGS